MATARFPDRELPTGDNRSSGTDEVTTGKEVGNYVEIASRTPAVDDLVCVRLCDAAVYETDKDRVAADSGKGGGPVSVSADRRVYLGWRDVSRDRVPVR